MMKTGKANKNRAGRATSALLGEKLESLYLKYNRREYVDPDPLAFLYDYPDIRDREIAGLVAACLAYGRVEMIMKTVGHVLAKMEPSPREFLAEASVQDLTRVYKGFRYRFATPDHLTALLGGIREVLRAFGAIESCFLGAITDPGDLTPGLARIYGSIRGAGDPGHLLADPAKSSACKRLYLFLRWMIREDEVDPGGWDPKLSRGLIVPLDTHMYRIGRFLGFTRRKSPDRACAREITKGFLRIAPEDPVKYDFSLTRYGIRRKFDMDDLRRYLTQ